jgi:hypothetical protein
MDVLFHSASGEISALKRLNAIAETCRVLSLSPVGFFVLLSNFSIMSVKWG